MSGTIQAVTLHSEQHVGKKLPPKAFGELLRVIPEAIRNGMSYTRFLMRLSGLISITQTLSMPMLR